MSQIKFEMSLDINDQKTVKAFADFLNIVAGAEPSVQTEQKTGEAKTDEPAPAKSTPAKSRASRAKNPIQQEETQESKTASDESDKEEDTAGSTANVAEDVKAEPAKEEAKNAPSVSLDDIRSNMSKKVADHREALQKKLKEYGAKNITTLPEDKYDEFNQFILDL